jgi:hypothetical protein
MLRKRPTRDPYALTNRFLVGERKAGGERLRVRGYGEAIAPKSEKRAVCVCFLTHQSTCHNILLIASHFGIVRLDRPPAVLVQATNDTPPVSWIQGHLLRTKLSQQKYWWTLE